MGLLRYYKGSQIHRTGWGGTLKCNHVESILISISEKKKKVKPLL